MSVFSKGTTSLSQIAVSGADGPGGSSGSWFQLLSQAVFGLAFVLSKQKAKETTSLVVLQTVDFF